MVVAAAQTRAGFAALPDDKAMQRVAMDVKVEAETGAPHQNQLDVLIAIGREINTYSEPAIIVAKLADALQPHLDFDAICLSVLEENALKCIASSKPDYWIPDFDRVSHPDHHLWPLLEAHSCLEVSMIGSAPFTEADAPSVQGTMTFINVPLIVNGRIFGLLHIDSHHQHHWSETEIGLARLVGGQIAAVVQGAQELIRRRERENELAQSLALLHATQEAVAEGICLIDSEGEVVSYNRRFAEMWNLTAADAQDLQCQGCLMAHVLEQLADPDEFILKIGELYEQPHALARDEIALRDGRTLERYSAPAIAPATATAPAVNCGRIWTFGDVSNRKLYESQLRHQAFHDALTGLPNRVLLLERMERARLKLERSRRALAILFLDLDRFKIINDSLGHDQGDQLLRQVAARLQSCLRPGDTAARFGGDEFVVLLEEVAHPDDAVVVARRIAASLQVPFDLDGTEMTVTTSVGIVLSSEPDEAPDELMRRADIAMYRAKNNGKAQFYLWNEKLSQGAIERLQLEIELQGAIKRGELEVWYQPLIDLRPTASGATASGATASGATASGASASGASASGASASGASASGASASGASASGASASGASASGASASGASASGASASGAGENSANVRAFEALVRWRHPLSWVDRAGRVHSHRRGERLNRANRQLRVARGVRANRRVERAANGEWARAAFDSR